MRVWGGNSSICQLFWFFVDVVAVLAVQFYKYYYYLLIEIVELEYMSGTMTPGYDSVLSTTAVISTVFQFLSGA